jgi:XRE family transcriptional regulator, regulator of sulfur utilization
MSLHKKIVLARKKKGLTQEQLAELTNVTVRTIQRIESGESAPRAYTIKAIAAVLDSSYEELTITDTENTLNSSTKSEIILNSDNEKHFLQMLCLSCFSYLVIPFLYFLIPSYHVKKSNPKNLEVLSFARKVVRTQIYWIIALIFIFLASLAYNFIRAIYYQKSHLLNYLWPFFIMYAINALIIISLIFQIKKVDFVSEENG